MKYNSFNDEHPENIQLILIISFLRNFLKYIDSMHSQSSNKLNNDLIL